MVLLSVGLLIVESTYELGSANSASSGRPSPRRIKESQLPVVTPEFMRATMYDNNIYPAKLSSKQTTSATSKEEPREHNKERPWCSNVHWEQDQESSERDITETTSRAQRQTRTRIPTYASHTTSQATHACCTSACQEKSLLRNTTGHLIAKHGSVPCAQYSNDTR